jgi:hypothetical protein
MDDTRPVRRSSQPVLRLESKTFAFLNSLNSLNSLLFVSQNYCQYKPDFLISV